MGDAIAITALDSVNKITGNDMERGKPFPLGATVSNEGVNFSIYSEHAEKIVLCLFDKYPASGSGREYILPGVTQNIHHGFIPGIKAGQLYGFRVYGPYNPGEGHRFNPNKLLLDPRAKAIIGTIRWNDACYAYEKDTADDKTYDDTDSAPYVQLSVVTDNEFDWKQDTKPNRPFDETIIYEMHVKGFTKLFSGLPEELRGTYAGLGHPAVIEYLLQLGITAVELLPVQTFISREELEKKGLTEYWGYNTMGFFAPEAKYSSGSTKGEQVEEFRQMVKALHEHGIEVILDVVYNHTGEGNHLGPTFCFRGLDNSNFYRLEPDDPHCYTDVTGTGNTVNTYQPPVLRMIMDSLRYWITEMHVDGFRFDLTPALARMPDAFNELSSFFSVIYQDPIVSKVKLIAEPWDIGDEGYQPGNFPVGWKEWNNKFRDHIRDYWRGMPTSLPLLLNRFMGSPDIFINSERTSAAGINFITAHDGFTLHDLVTYKEKHNEENGFDNEDGGNDNRSINWGIEGETMDEGINRLRKQHKRNLLATLLLSRSTPMLLAGDEMGNTQQGNNNAFCQDNEISWINWERKDDELLAFTQYVIRLRKEHSVFNPKHHKHTGVTILTPEDDIIPFPGTKNDNADSFLILLEELHHVHTGEANGSEGERFCIIFNNTAGTTRFRVPECRRQHTWQVVLNTFYSRQDEAMQPVGCDNISVDTFSIMVLQEINHDIAE